MYPQFLDYLAGPGLLPERVGSLTGEAHQQAVRDLVVNNKFLNKAWVNISCDPLTQESGLFIMIEGEEKCYRDNFSLRQNFNFRFVFSGPSAVYIFVCFHVFKNC